MQNLFRDSIDAAKDTKSAMKFSRPAPLPLSASLLLPYSFAPPFAARFAPPVRQWS